MLLNALALVATNPACWLLQRHRYCISVWQSGPHYRQGEKTVLKQGRLLRVLGLAFGLAAVVGGVIGQGILRSPGVVAAATGSPSLILALWAGVGLLVLAAGMCYAELAAAIPRAGGFYAYVARAIGPRVGIAVGLAGLFGSLLSLAILSFVIGEFLIRLGIPESGFGPQGIGLLALAGFCMVNALGTRVSGGLQVGFAAFKGSVLIALVIALLANPGSVSPTQPASVLRSDWIAIGTALVVIWNTFNGWQNVVFFAEEVDDPGRNIPRSLVFGILAITAIYLLVNFALIHTLGTADMAGSKLAVADAAGLAIGETADVAIAIFSVISVAAIANYMLVSASRLLFSLARAGLFPAQMAYVDPRGTPLFAMLAIALAASGFLLTGTYLTLVSMQAPSTILALIVVMAALVILRRREPDLARPFRVPLYPFSVGFVILFASALFVVSLIQDPISGALGLLVNGGLIAAVLILAGERAKEARPPDLNEDDQ